jgi:hypothetical protein
MRQNPTHTPRRRAPHATARRSLAGAVAAASLSAMSACASRPDDDGGVSLCARSVALTKRRVGPEFGKAVHQLPIPLSEGSYGCAIVFTRVDEEMPGEVSGEYGANRTSQELALALSDAQGQLAITLPPSPLYRESAVRLETSLMEVRGVGTPELVVKELSLQPSIRYQGLRLFAFAAGVPTPREIFSEEVVIKTPEGITVHPQWSVEPFEGDTALLFKGGGEFMVFLWHEGMQRFQHDLAASLRIKESGRPSSTPKSVPRPTAPVTPTTP